MQNITQEALRLETLKSQQSALRLEERIRKFQNPEMVEDARPL